MRADRGLSSLPALQGHTKSLMLWWLPGREGESHHYEYDCVEPLNLRHFMPEQWKSLRLVQFLCTDPTAPHSEALTRVISANEERDHRDGGGGRAEAVTPDGSVPAEVGQPPSDTSGRLSTIPEEPSDADE